MHIARTAAVIFALINVLGLVWYMDTVQSSTLLYGVTAIICALVVSLTPRSLITANKTIAMAMLVLCIVGIGAIAFLVMQDYQRSYGPDMGAITLRVLFASTFVFIGLAIRRHASGQ